MAARPRSPFFPLVYPCSPLVVGRVWEGGSGVGRRRQPADPGLYGRSHPPRAPGLFTRRIRWLQGSARDRDHEALRSSAEVSQSGHAKLTRKGVTPRRRRHRGHCGCEGRNEQCPALARRPARSIEAEALSRLLLEYPRKGVWLAPANGSSSACFSDVKSRYPESPRPNVRPGFLEGRPADYRLSSSSRAARSVGSS